ncbi:unnamed protein product [Darwinula stevensoni]|uniref:DOMON domain-containing protein n=1 Tax=Darwinula stevensoni TaxID=69355 RepID=A0A7R9A8I8_9CRUS|nr:unnamed protein product [Darwinula stevensoni]CAG0896502.1 unnamed protein product [Darwinula stevensoni]
MVSKAIRFTLGFCLVIGGISLPHVSGWEREAILDPLGKVHLAWTPHLETKVIEFEYTVQTLGWVGLGFSPTGGMLNSDVITAWIKDGRVFFNDRHVPVEHELPRVDDVSNYNLISAVETNATTIIRFTREFDTCDLEQDFHITGDTVKVIYAFGDTDPDGEDPFYHGSDNRGTKSLYLLDPPLGMDREQRNGYSDIGYHILVHHPKDTRSRRHAPHHRREFKRISPLATLWKCLSDPRFILVCDQYKPYVKPGNEKYVHHLLMYACSIPDELVDVFNSWAEHDGVLCYGPDHPQEWNQCRSVLIAWAVGGEDDSGLTVYYTDVLRPLEMATLGVGSSLHPASSNRVYWGPSVSVFMNVGLCNPKCTEIAFPPEGIHIFSGFLHSHLLGKRMRVRVFRKGEELPWLQNDDNYDFDYQQVRVFREHITLYPGDQLIMECDYDSSNRDSVTVSGFGTTEEMCMGFFQYYPAMNFPVCMSYPHFESIFSLFGITDVWLDPDGGYEYMVSEDQTLVDYLNEFDWSGINMEGFQHLLRYEPHYTLCFNNQGDLTVGVVDGMASEKTRLILCLVAISSARGWEREAILDPAGKVHLAWTPHADSKVIEFRFAVQTLGWVGLGFSSNGGMRDSDVVTAWVKDGKVFFTDRHVGSAYEVPKVDNVSNYNLVSATENATATVVRFTREFDTCDLDRDFYITDGTVHVIYAYGDSDPQGDDPYYHGRDKRGSKSLYLLDPSSGGFCHQLAAMSPIERATLRPIVYYEFLQGHSARASTDNICAAFEGNVVHYSTVSRWSKRLESGDTTFGDRPRSGRPSTYKANVKPGNEKYVHHLLLYACSVPSELVAKFDSWTRRGGHLCYGRDHPREWRLCRSVLVAWAVGGEGETYPENVGYVIPEGGIFFMMEMHYDNPEKVSGVQDSSGLIVYYTDVLRPLEMANLEIGAFVGPTQASRNNTRQSAFVNVGHCSSKCTEASFPPEGIHVFSGLLHSHLIECYYDSSNRTSVTVGGFGTQEEMCLGFFQYYPAQNLAACLSLPKYEDMFAFIRLNNVYLDQENGYKYWASKNQKNQKNQTLVDYLDRLNWSHDDIESLQRLLRDHPHNALCTGNNGTHILAILYYERFQGNPTATTYRLEGRRGFQAPIITVCRTPSFKREENFNFIANSTMKFSSLIEQLGFSPREVIDGCLLNRKVFCTPDNEYLEGDILHTPGGVWRHRITYSREKSWKTAFLDSCFSFHPNASTGVGGDLSGYLLSFSQPSDVESKATSWEVYVHQDLKWASMHLAASYARIRVAPGTYNQVVLSSKEVQQMDTESYPCEARLNYSQDQCWDECLWKAAVEWAKLRCQLPNMNLGLPICESVSSVFLLAKGCKDHNEEVASLPNCSCPPPCHSTRYDVQIRPTETRSLIETDALLAIYFPRGVAEVLIENPAYDLAQMIGEFGGCLGMFLGISLVNIFELVENFIKSRIETGVVAPKT